MSDEKDIITVDQTPAEYGDRQAVATFGKRIKAMLPGGDKMTDAQAMALAQYSMLLDANPFRGEVYGYTDSHGFHLVDGYKMLVRWARKQCPYTETYKPIEDLPQDAIGFRCYILRDDAKPTLREFVDLGATFDQAYELATVSAVGVVTKSDMTTKKGTPMAPPAGWTWRQVARKRALKNALNLSHGAPSPREIAAQSWEVDGIKTEIEDWANVTPDMPVYEREAIAAGNARAREVPERASKLDIDANQAADALFDTDGQGIQHITAPDYSGHAPDANVYEDKQELGRDVSQLVPQDWHELYTMAAEQYNVTPNAHVQNIIRKVYPGFAKRGQEQPSIVAAWNAFVEYEQSKAETATQEKMSL
jgi:hypothetical protein